MTLITDIEIVQYLANGYIVKEISQETNISRRTLEKRIEVIRERTLSKNQTQLVANFFRKNLIQ